MTHTSTEQDRKKCTACNGAGGGKDGWDCLTCSGDGWVFAEPTATHTSTEQPEALREYEVCVIFDVSRNVTVLATSPEQAVELAEDGAYGSQNLCNKCSDHLDTGDIAGSHVYEGGKQVLESTAAGELRLELSAAKARIAELEASQARVRAIAVSALLTGSRDRQDWIDDMNRIEAIAQGKQG